jgi:hypothetical protein
MSNYSHGTEIKWAWYPSAKGSSLVRFQSVLLPIFPPRTHIMCNEEEGDNCLSWKQAVILTILNAIVTAVIVIVIIKMTC